MINGAPTDNNAKLFKQGAHSVLDHSGVKISREYDTPDWSPDKAETEMDQAIASIGNRIAGVYAANDGTAGGAIAAMKGRGINPAKVPVTGQDAELAAIQRILMGDQYMTVYKAIKPEALAAAKLAVALVHGRRPAPGLVNGKIPNGQKEVPSVLLRPVVVTKSNVKTTVVKDGFLKPSDICKARAAAVCKAEGIA
jgi:D-xylose transport system substrate-binding protein